MFYEVNLRWSRFRNCRVCFNDRFEIQWNYTLFYFVYLNYLLSVHSKICFDMPCITTLLRLSFAFGRCWCKFVHCSKWKMNMIIALWTESYGEHIICFSECGQNNRASRNNHWSKYVKTRICANPPGEKYELESIVGRFVIRDPSLCCRPKII